MTEPMSPPEGTSPTPAPVPTAFTGRIRVRTSELARVGLIVGCLVVLIASAAVASGASPTPTPDGAGGSTAPSTAPDKVGPFGAQRGGPGGAGGFFGHMFGGGGMFGGGPGADGRGFGLGGGPSAGGPGIGRAITITKIDGSDVSLKTDDGWTRTIAITDKTEIRIGSQKGTLSDLKVGDTVNLNETKNSEGTYTVTLVVVRVPTIAGTVTVVSSTGFTLKQRDGSTKTVTVSGSTDYLIAGAAGAKADVVVGSRVQVEGSAGTGDAFSATVVHISPDVKTGTVTDTSATSITIKTRDGSSATIHVDAKTTFRVAGSKTATIADVKSGMVLSAQGTARSDGSLDAVSVFAGQFKMPAGPHPGKTDPRAPPSLPAG